MANKIDGPAVAAIGIGALFLYGGIRGQSILKAIQNVVTGQNPTSGQSETNTLVNPASFTVTSGGNSVGPVNAQGLTNPIGPGLIRGRIDEGVDFSGAGDLYAMGAGTIQEVQGSGWPGGIFIRLVMSNGMDIYYAENITPAVSVGQTVSAGQKIGHANGTYPFIEIGFATGDQTAAAASHYTEGVPTSEGQQMASLLSSLGAP